MTIEATIERGRGRAAATVSDIRRKGAERSLSLFAQTYLSDHFRCEPAKMHLEIAALLQKASLREDGRGTRIAIAAPRGHAKSTLISLAYALWCVCYAKEPYILLVSDTADQAVDHLKQVKDELEGNERLREDFPEVCEAPGKRPGPTRWRKNDIITRGPGDGVRIQALGAEQKIRGRRSRTNRPSLIILDDLDNEELVRSPDQRDKRWDWLNKAALKAGTPTTNVVVAGTVLHHDSILARLLDQRVCPGWTARKYKAVVSWATRQDLWERWETIFNHRDEHRGESGPKAALQFFDERKSEMLEGAETAWPARESYVYLMELRLQDGRASFDSEKQNEPVDANDCLFPEHEFVYWDDQFQTEEQLLASLPHHAPLYGACDPSMGKAGRDRDDSAIVTLIEDPASGILYVLDADIRRRKPDVIIEDLIKYAQLRRWHTLQFEEVQFQEYLKTELERRSRERRIYINVNGLRPVVDKLGRIQRLQPYITTGRLRFSRRHRTLLDQLRQFPHAAHDDGPDALEMALRGADGPQFAFIEVPEEYML